MKLSFSRRLLAGLLAITLLVGPLQAQVPKRFRSIRRIGNPVSATGKNSYRLVKPAGAAAVLRARRVTAETQHLHRQILARVQHVQLTHQQNELLFRRAEVLSLQDLPKAQLFWHEDAQKIATQILTQPQAISIQKLNYLIADVSAIGMFSSQENEADFLLNLHEQLASTPIAPYLTTSVTRALLRLRAYDAVKHLASNTLDETELWHEIAAYIRQHKLPCRLPNLGAGNPANAPAKQSFDEEIVFRADDPSAAATSWYMQLALGTLAEQRAGRALTSRLPAPSTPILPPSPPNFYEPSALALSPANMSFTGFTYSDFIPVDRTKIARAPLAQHQQEVSRLTKQNTTQTEPDATWWQRTGLYMSSFIIGLEVGQPIIAAMGETFELSLSKNILVSAATFLPYSLGAFGADWIKSKIGKKACLNTGLALAGGSFWAGSHLLGLNGHFALWNNPNAQFYSILGAIALASWGGTLIHSSLGPIISDISRNTTELRRDKRIAFTELGEASGLLASYFFPLLSTELLGLDWSAPFLLSWPLVAMAAIGVNTSRLRNFKTPVQPVSPKIPHKTWKQKILTNPYVQLIKTDKSAAYLLKGLLLLNGIELSLNSGFLLMLPSLTQSTSSQYVLGLAQFAAPYVVGSYLGNKFLKWFPNKNMTVSAALAAAGGIGAIFCTHNVYALTASLATAELGLSAAYTLSFTKAAKKPQTQDRMTSLILASVVTAAAGPYLLTQVAQALINLDLVSAATASSISLIAIPGLLSLCLLRTFKKLETENPISIRRKINRWFKNRRSR